MWNGRCSLGRTTLMLGMASGHIMIVFPKGTASFFSRTSGKKLGEEQADLQWRSNI